MNVLREHTAAATSATTQWGVIPAAVMLDTCWQLMDSTVLVRNIYNMSSFLFRFRWMCEFKHMQKQVMLRNVSQRILPFNLNSHFSLRILELEVRIMLLY